MRGQDGDFCLKNPFLNGHSPASFSLILSFQTNNTIFHQTNVKKCKVKGLNPNFLNATLVVRQRNFRRSGCHRERRKRSRR